MGRIGTGSTDVFSAASGIDVRAESIDGVLRTCYVGEAGVVGNAKASANGIVPKELIGSNGRASVAAPGKGTAAVQQKLNR
jgi:hypothetical protein